MNSNSSEVGFKLLIVDDHSIVREGIKHILDPESNHWEVVEAAHGAQALAYLNSAHFALAIVDLSMPGMGGIELTHRIKAEFPASRVLVMSMHGEEQYALRAFKAGANGYLTKDSAPTELVKAVRKVLNGGAYVTPHLAERVVLQLNGGVAAAGHAELSDREIEVLRRFVAGQRPIDIAKALHLSIKTISTHKTRIQEKLQLSSMAALIRYGIEHHVDDGYLP